MFLRRLLPLAGALVAAGVVGSPGFAADQAPAPVPSLTPEKTARLWEQLVDRPRALSFRTAVCTAPVRAVFYAPTDWIRLATKLAATPSPCADYYISVPPLSADKTQFRTDQAWRIRALGSQFHALAEVNVSGWSGWVAANGGNWHAAGVEARRRLAAAGYDVGAGDSWVVNELSSAVRQGVGSARENMRAFIRGLYEGDGSATARGAVFVTGMSQATTELSVYQSRLQDWYEDAPFWEDMSRYVIDWTQELYGDVRNWAAPGTDAAARTGSLNEYLQHELALARVAPGSGTAAASYLTTAYVPLGNAAWAYDAAFGWTDVSAELMQSYVSSQVAAMRSYRDSRLGFAWTPKNLHAVATADFNTQTDALLDRLAAAIAGADACAPSWCGGDLDGAAFNSGWQTFAAWKPSSLAFTTAPQTLPPDSASSAVTVQLRTNTGVAYTAGLPVPVTFQSSSAGGSFSTAATGPWSSRLTTEIASDAGGVTVYYRDAAAGSPTITASAPGKVAATQVETISTAPGTPPPPAPTPAGSFFVGFAEDLPKEIGAEAVTPATQLGGSAFRLTLTWSPGQTSLTSTEAQKLDRAVAAAAGTRLVLAVYGATADAAPTDATRRDQYCGYVRDVLGRYPSIRDVVIWNEPNKSLFWRPQVNADGSVASPAAYQALLARCWDVLHAANPNVNVLGLALSSTGNDDSGSRSPGDFIRRVGDAFRASGRTSRILDTVAYHPYPSAASERPWRRHIGSKVIGMGDWNKLMYNLWLAFNGTAQPIPGEADVRIWYTEMGFQTAVVAAKAPAYTGTENTATIPDWAGGEPEAPAPAETSAAPDQGTQALDAIRLAACQPHVGAFFNFLLADEPILAGWQSGPLWADRTPKGSYESFRTAIALASGGGVDCSTLKGGPPSGDFMPPAAPADVSATAARDPLRVDVAWSASTGDSSPVSYRVYRNGAWVGTTSETSWSNTTVTEGASYSYTVRAIDSAGNLGDASAAASATVPDVTAPTVSVTTPLEGARVRGTVTLEATAADNLGLARVELLVNDSVVATVATPPYAAGWASTTLADGTATIGARAIDNAGNVATAAQRTVTVDNTPPQATITSAPPASTTDTSASFGFSATEADVSFQCSLDASPFTACASPQTYSGLAGGEHVFQVRAADAAGNVQSPPAERRWTVVVADTQAPETTITSGASGTTTSTSASFSFSASEAGSTFECALDGAPFAACTSPRSYSGLGGGEHTFAVRARDAAGNLDASPATRTWTIFNDAFLAARPLPGASGGVSGSNVGATKESGEPYHAGDRGGTSVWFTWTAPGSGSVTIDTRGSAFDTLLAVYTGSSVSALTTIAANNNDGGYSTSRVAFTASAGTVYRIAVDGRRGRSGGYALNWNQVTSTPPPPGDTTPPDTAITSGPSGTVAATDASFGFTSTESGSTFECRLDAAAFAACTSPRAYSAMATGTHTFEVRAKDASGNLDGSPASRTWTISSSTSTSNDMFANAKQLALGSGTTTGSTVGMSKEAGEPNHAGNAGGRSIWFSWTAPKTATVTFDTIGSPYDTLLAAYTGVSVSALTARASNDDASGLQSRITFSATAGVTYQVAVDGYNGASGGVTLNWSQP